MSSETPFAPGSDSSTFLETLACARWLARVDEDLGAREPVLLLTGEPGVGKTELVRATLAHLAGRATCALVAYPALGPAELLEEIVRRLGGEPGAGASRPVLLGAFERALAAIAARGQVALVAIDDAHELPRECLEALRLLPGVAQHANARLEFLLAGLPALEATLEQPALTPLRQRIAFRDRLEPLGAGETRRYLRHRVTAGGGDGGALIPRAACLEIASRSGGVPRAINALASAALRLARAAGAASVGPEHVEAAAATLGVLPSPPSPSERDDEAEVEPQVAPVTPVAPRRATAPSASVVPAAPRRAIAPGAPPAPAPERAEARASIPPSRMPPAPRPEPATAAKSAVLPAPQPPAPRPEPVAARRSDASPPVATPASQDPQEWVKRFVGDAGPLQIGSRAGPGSDWTRATFDPADGAEPATAGETPRRAGSAPPPARARERRLVAIGVPLATLLALFVVGGAIGLVIRAGLRAMHPRAEAARTSAGIAQRPAPAARSAEPATTVRPEPAAGPPSPPAAPAGRGPFTLEVGVASDLPSAFARRDSLKSLVGIGAWVVPSADSAATPHRIVLGVYRSRARAEAARQMLIGSRTLTEVTVVSLPPRRARR
ncbi:MAG TPA: AAA family ATPase [Candidatus Acidoferrales bacterium]|nr:AAA family ATPase [Candidatus Acidoferrales bacterium]